MKWPVAVSVVCCLFSTIVRGQGPLVPALINYQGNLTGTNGQPLETREYSIAFSLYDAATGGTAVWGPQTFDGSPERGHGARVPVVRGFFNVILGPTDVAGRPLLDAFANTGLFLEISVEGSAILPRAQILAAPFAAQAGNGAPPGSIVAYWGATPPLGWLLCNGDPIPDEPRYRTLRKLVGNNAPNLSGRVVVGAGAGAGLTKRSIGEAFGVERHALVTGEMPNHRHQVAGSTGGQNSNNCCIGARALPGSDGHDHTHALNLPSAGPTDIGPGAPHENMQPSLAVTYIIKY